MIISHLHRYVFIQIPHTASTAIANYLTEHYDGHKVLLKHSFLDEFYHLAKPAWRSYYKFCAVRHPLDDVLSMYSKLKSNHLGLYTPGKQETPIYSIERPDEPIGSKARGAVGKRRSAYIADHDLSFEAYFNRYVRVPYESPVSILKDKYDAILRFEQIDEDLRAALQEIGITDPAPLHRENRTGFRESDYAKYYTANMLRRCHQLFGPFMSNWGYTFPDGQAPDFSRLQYLMWYAGSKARLLRWRLNGYRLASQVRHLELSQQ